MTVIQDLINWKTHAWKSQEMVAWYHKRMVETHGIRKLKNQVETSLCARYAFGPKLLDVGIGTGRASLPLARAGFDVTGVDSSLAMLEQTRKLAGDTPIRLLQGDIANLEFADGEFDCVMSLNVLVHFPNWQDILAELQRVTRPGGRILFDIHSMDHEDAVYEANGLLRKPDDPGEDFVGYTSKIRVVELVEAANRQGLRIVAVVPSVGVFAEGNINLWLKNTLAEGKHYERLLSWLTSDKALEAFTLFLEQDVFAHLTSRFNGLMMVVIDNTSDESANQSWLERDVLINMALANGVNTKIFDLIPAFDSDWRQRLNAHLEHPRNRVLLHFLLSAWRNFPGRLDLASFLEEHHAMTLAAWRSQDELDRLATHIPRALGELPPAAEILQHNGVPLAGGLDYDLTRDLLRKTFHAFN
jgi:SAM-dependent methyltransferase